MQEFERVYMRTLRHIYDTEKQLAAAMGSLGAQVTDPGFASTLREIHAQSSQQLARLDSVFRLLYLEPRAEPAWVTTALLREAHEAGASPQEGGAQGCAAALLAIKRYEITLYEALLRWSEQCQLDEPIADIRRCIAEELVQASILSEFAFEQLPAHADELTFAEKSVLH